MQQKEIRSHNGNPFTVPEAVEWLKELDDRTKSDNEDLNSITDIINYLQSLSGGGVNLIVNSEILHDKILNANGELTSNTSYEYIDFKPIEENTDYVVSVDRTNEPSPYFGYLKLSFYDESQNHISQVYFAGYQWTVNKFKTPANTKFFRASGLRMINRKLQLEKGIFNSGYKPNIKDMFLKNNESSFNLTTPDGTKQYKIAIDNSGNLTTTLV